MYTVSFSIYITKNSHDLLIFFIEKLIQVAMDKGGKKNLQYEQKCKKPPIQAFTPTANVILYIVYPL